jgi:hypothetical protein
MARGGTRSTTPTPSLTNNNNILTITNRTRLDHLKYRIRCEIQLLRLQAGFFIGAGIIMTYFSALLFRNLAFYRFEPQPRLRDIGFELIPDLEHSIFFHHFMDIPMDFTLASTGIVCILTLFSQNSYPPFAVNMLRRVLWMLCVGHCMRFLTYMSTTMPGPNETCLPGHLDDNHPRRPTTWKEIFTRFAFNPGNGCGDLMFSGHMLSIISPVLMIGYYGNAVLIQNQYLSKPGFYGLMIILFTMIIGQGIIIVCSRNHYTSDIVVATYLTPLLWNFYVGALYPKDVIPPAFEEFIVSVVTEEDEPHYEEIMEYQRIHHNTNILPRRTHDNLATGAAGATALNTATSTTNVIPPRIPTTTATTTSENETVMLEGAFC